MKNKKCPNPIIISSNIGIQNFVKEMLPFAPYMNPPFAFPPAKEKRKYRSTSVRMEKKILKKNKKIVVSRRMQPVSK